MKQAQHRWSRRKFIISASSAGALIMLNPFLSWAIDEPYPRVAEIAANRIKRRVFIIL